MTFYQNIKRVVEKLIDIQFFEISLGVFLLGWASFALLSVNGFFGFTALDSDVHVNRSDPRFGALLSSINEKGTSNDIAEAVNYYLSESDGLNGRSVEQMNEEFEQFTIAELTDFLGIVTTSTEITRRAALEKILDRGNEQDIAFLFAFIASKNPPSMSFNEWRAFVTNIVDYLVHEWPSQQESEDRLLNLYNRSELSPVAQNAILKQMDSLYIRSNEPDVIESLLWKAIHKPEPLAATALTRLARLTATASEVSENKLSLKAMNISRSFQASPTSRVIAMKIAHWLGNPELNKTILDILGDENEPPVVHLAAVSILFEQGGSSELYNLKKLAEEGDLTISDATRKAIELTLAAK